MKLLTIVLLVFTFQSIGFSQETHDVERGMTVSQTGTDKEILIKENKKIKIWLEGEENGISGKYSVVNDSTIQINNTEYLTSSLTAVRVPVTALRIIGGVLTVAGATITGVGLAVLSVAFTSSDPAEQIVALIGGVFLVGVGVLPTAVGIPLMFTGKKYKGGNWEFGAQL